MQCFAKINYNFIGILVNFAFCAYNGFTCLRFKTMLKVSTMHQHCNVIDLKTLLSIYLEDEACEL